MPARSPPWRARRESPPGAPDRGAARSAHRTPPGAGPPRAANQVRREAWPRCPARRSSSLASSDPPARTAPARRRVSPNREVSQTWSVASLGVPPSQRPAVSMTWSRKAMSVRSPSGSLQGDVEQPVAGIEVEPDGLERPGEGFGSWLERDGERTGADDLQFEERGRDVRGRPPAPHAGSRTPFPSRVRTKGRRPEPFDIPGIFRVAVVPSRTSSLSLGWVGVPNEATAPAVLEPSGGHQRVLERLEVLRLLEARREAHGPPERLAKRSSAPAAGTAEPG